MSVREMSIPEWVASLDKRVEALESGPGSWTKDQQDGMRATLHALKARAERAEAERDRLRTEVERITRERDAWKISHDSLRGLFDDVQGRRAAAEAERDRLRENNDLLIHMRKRVEERNDELRAKLEAAEAERDRLRAEVERITKERDQDKNALAFWIDKAKAHEATVARLTAPVSEADVTASIAGWDATLPQDFAAQQRWEAKLRIRINDALCTFLARRLQAEPPKHEPQMPDLSVVVIQHANGRVTHHMAPPRIDLSTATRGLPAEPVAPQGAVKVEPPDVAPPEVVSEPVKSDCPRCGYPSCTCGSGAHPRACSKHPKSYDAHVNMLNREAEQDEKLETLEAENALLREKLDAVRRRLVESGEENTRLKAHVCPTVPLTKTADALLAEVERKCLGLGVISGWVDVGKKAAEVVASFKGRFAVVAAPVEPETLTDEQAWDMGRAVWMLADIKDIDEKFRAMGKAAWAARPVVE